MHNKRILFKLTLILIVQVLITNCTDNVNIKFSEKLNEAKKITGKIISQENEILSEPLRMGYSEPFIIYFSGKGDKVLKIFDTNKGVVKRGLCNEGMGPQELMMVGSIQVSDKHGICLYDIVKKKIYTLNLSTGKLTKRGETKENASQAFLMDDLNQYILNGVFHNGRFKVYKKDSLVFNYKKFPKLGTENRDTIIMNLGYQNFSAISPNHQKFANIVFNSEIIEGYSLADNIIVEKWRHELSMLPFKPRKIGDGLIVAHAEEEFGFKNMAVTNEFIFCTYSNLSIDELKPFTASGKFLFKFDWEGNILKVYELDYPVRTIAVSANGKNLYGTTILNDDIKILKYDLF